MTKSIPLTQGKFALVDDDMFEYLNQWKWTAHKGSTGIWYALRIISVGGKQKTIPMHRLILNTPKDKITDHVDHDGLNNQRYNLRESTKSQNGANSRNSKNNTSGFRGVALHKPSRKWLASIRINRKSIYLGYFDDVKEVAHAYDDAAKKHFGKFANLNFP